MVTKENNLIIFGEHDAATINQARKVLEYGAEKFVLCADGHLGYGFPVGGVALYKDSISLNGAGYDLGCGCMAVKTDIESNYVKENIDIILDKIVSEVSFGVGRNNNKKVEHELFNDPLFESNKFISSLKNTAKDQLGTVGSGNHYVDLLEGDDGVIWIAVHFGSRGFGHKIATHFMKLMGAKDGMDVPPTMVEINSEIGQDYINSINLAGKYAYAGREYVVDTVCNILGVTQKLDMVHNHHNFVWRENHFGEDYWVARKGATPAFPSQRGFIGGSMGDNAYIVEGIDSDLSRESLFSTVHGAGRIMSRAAAKGRFIKDENGKKQRQNGLIRHDEWQKWIKEAGVTVRGGDVDEAPQAYRRLNEVIESHNGTIKILHTLKPIGVCMASNKIVDPYKD